VAVKEVVPGSLRATGSMPQEGEGRIRNGTDTGCPRLLHAGPHAIKAADLSTKSNSDSSLQV
jgi:hypothetical protein